MKYFALHPVSHWGTDNETFTSMVPFLGYQTNQAKCRLVESSMMKRSKSVNPVRRSKPRRPPLTDKTMSGLKEIVTFIEAQELTDILGDDPRSWRGLPRATELTKRGEAIAAACTWVQSLEQYKAVKDLRKNTSKQRD